MTIAAFKKITLFGKIQLKERILKKLQALGCMHLITIQQKKRKEITIASTTPLDQIKKALQYLQDSPQYGKQKKFLKDFDADKTVATILENQSLLREAIDRHDFLQERIKDLSIWGNFVFPQQGELKDIKLWFYKIQHKDIPLLSKNLIIQEIYRDNQFLYIVILSAEEPAQSALPKPRIHTGSIPLNQLRQEFIEINERIDDLNEERRQLTRLQYLLKQELARFEDRTTLQLAHAQTQDENDFFLVQGWVPEKELLRIQSFCIQHKLGMSIETPAANELPPTEMETFPWARAGIELVKFYQTPSYHSLDPSAIVFFSFAVFFAMILADAGYGFIIALLTLLSWKWLNKSNASPWLKPLLVTISIFSIGYGMLVGSYFGVTPAENSFLYKFKLLDINNFNTMMKIVLVIGCLHIIAANGLRAWFAKNLLARMQAIGFIIFIVGVMLLIMGLINKIHFMTPLSVVLIVMSLLAIMIFASDLPVTNLKSFGKRTFFGVAALAELSGLFGDVLSYLRLFALGLAGASLAITFNRIAAHIANSTMGGHGWILAFLVLLFGQVLNFVLCIMSGVIHGLRLNYIEFFKWSVKEEGYSYAPLKKTETFYE